MQGVLTTLLFMVPSTLHLRFVSQPRQAAKVSSYCKILTIYEALELFQCPYKSQHFSSGCTIFPFSLAHLTAGERYVPGNIL
ncbi:hypothetical protein T4E_9768 [Trichinella pseudospiralis]|uniref:Secreted protein n=1 Tax=Trichinella pseudospiralis TaxID=6337 RepID=A0A0V0Y608_TRIPS|nr:hypothetical protein T4E_9768 [Trichinella pseudospiralis]